jgi:hypothetical protein
MPRVGDVFQLLSGTLAVPNTTIQSAPYNAQQQDWTLEANSARPISAGGTGATTASAARVNLGAIGAGDLAAAATKTPLVDTDSIVIIDSVDTVSATKNKRWLLSDFRTSLATMTNTNFTLVSTDATAAAGPTLTLDRQSPSPQSSAANPDLLGYIRWLGRNSAEVETVTYADIYVQITDHVNNQEKSTIVLRNMVNGAPTLGFQVDQAGMTVRTLTSQGNITTPGSVQAGNYYGSGGTGSGVLLAANAIGETQWTAPVLAVYGNAVGGDSKNSITFYTGGTGTTAWGLAGYFHADKRLITTGDILAGASVIANNGIFHSPGATVLSSNSNTVYLRPYGMRTDISVATNEAYLQTDGKFVAPILRGGSIETPGAVSCSGLTISGAANYITMTDTAGTSASTRYIHHNDGLIGFLNYGGGWSFYVNDAGTTTVPVGAAYTSGSTVVGQRGFSLGDSGTGGTLITSSNTTTTTHSHMVMHTTYGASGRIWTNSNITHFDSASDGRLKEAIENYDQMEAVRVIKADPVVEWDWKQKFDDGPGVRAVGWIAQNSYAVDRRLAAPPSAGKENLAPGDPDYEPWMIDYGRRTPYLWAALSWALDQIDDLKARLETIEGTPA